MSLIQKGVAYGFRFETYGNDGIPHRLNLLNKSGDILYEITPVTWDQLGVFLALVQDNEKKVSYWLDCEGTPYYLSKPRGFRGGKYYSVPGTPQDMYPIGRVGEYSTLIDLCSDVGLEFPVYEEAFKSLENEKKRRKDPKRWSMLIFNR